VLEIRSLGCGLSVLTASLGTGRLIPSRQTSCDVGSPVMRQLKL
jgi:hypothetical protein